MSGRLNGLLYASIGFFLVEDNLQRGSLLYNDSTHVGQATGCECRCRTSSTSS